MRPHNEIDPVTGVETTGHVWDGDLKELNKPLPKWWLYVLYATIVWAIGYWVLYPAWPMFDGYTKGVLGYSQRATVAMEVSDARANQQRFAEAIVAKTKAEIERDPDLMEFVLRGGAALFANNCAGCHGRGAQGAKGYPNLNDDDWLWGGTTDAIEATIRAGVRSGHTDTHESAMPRFGLDQALKPAEINDAAAFVRSLAGHGADEQAEAVERGRGTFSEQCAGCHGEAGKGSAELGAPNLTDGIWLYGGTKSDVVESIRTGRGGVMPAWTERLDPTSIKMLAIYVHALGGGK